MKIVSNSEGTGGLGAKGENKPTGVIGGSE